jgi:branched-subunit amino acid ABC-type transport system permease component
MLPYLVTGIVAGSLYGLAGLGLVLTYRTSGVFNFAHGAVAAGAAFLFYTLHDTHHIPWPIAAVMTVVLFGVVVGWALDRITRPLAGASDVVVVVATVGILLAIEGFLYLQYGDATRAFPAFLPSSGFRLQGVTVSWAEIISILVAGGGAAALYLFLQRTRLGVAMRAVVDNPTLVRLSGDRADRIRLSAWAIGSGAAAVSGILLAPTLNLDVNLLTFLVVQAFAACAIGCFTSLPLTFLGGLVVGVAASLATKYAQHPPFNGLPASMPFLVLVAVLLVVPVARLPRSRSVYAGLTAGASTLPRWVKVSGAAVGVLVPAVVGTKLPVWISALSYVIIFASLALLVWGSGQLSLCHAAFLALGATTMSHLTHAGVPWLVALLLAGLLTVPVGALVAIPAIRLSGIYLALATLGFGILMQDVIYGTFLMFGAQLDARVTRPRLGFINATNDKWMYYIALAVAGVCLAAMIGISRARFGRLLRAMAQTPTMLSTQGLGVNLTRLIVFCVSAFFAGIGGALAVTQTGAANAVTFGPLQSLLLVAVLAVCGTRMLRSSIFAALLLAVLPGYVAFSSDRQLLVFGAVAVTAAIALARRRTLEAWMARAAASSASRRHRGPAAPPRRASQASPNGTHPPAAVHV